MMFIRASSRILRFAATGGQTIIRGSSNLRILIAYLRAEMV